MRAILIDPSKRSLETIDIEPGTSTAAMMHLRQLVGENALDFAHILPGESIAVGDHSAQANPPLPSYSVAGYKWPLYGRGVVLGFHADGRERETTLSVDELSQMIEFH